MATVTGPNGNTYYYKSVKINGRVTRRYLGSGPFGALVDSCERLLGEEARGLREARREVERASGARRATEEAEVVEAFGRVDSLVAILLGSAGFRRHRRGEWRKARG